LTIVSDRRKMTETKNRGCCDDPQARRSTHRCRLCGNGNRRGRSAPAATTIPYLWQNCKHVNARYPHGVGRRFAHDNTSGTPVTNFKRSAALYLTAMRYNRGLDRDKDGIACEKP
jgi:Excalibur calcium-binding domain